MTLVAGVDGGQSSTVAVIVDDAERVLGRGVAGPSDHVDEPVDSHRCADACELAVARALAAAKLAPLTPLETVVVGLSGFDGAMHGAAPRFSGATVRFEHDAPIALAGAIAQRPGVIVIAGTGSVAYGEAVDGRAIRIGGFGYLFGDVGSAFVLARDALAYAMAQEDHGNRTGVGQAALAYFNQPNLRALARAYYLKEIPRPELATFARVVLDAVRLGDPEAGALVDAAANALADLATTAIERLKLAGKTVPVAFIGGMTKNVDLHARAARALAARAPHAITVSPAHEPAIGAARMALGRW